jgi:hypothetical protein
MFPAKVVEKKAHILYSVGFSKIRAFEDNVEKYVRTKQPKYTSLKATVVQSKKQHFGFIQRLI